MAGEENDRERSFKVKDRRRFSQTGEARTDIGDSEESGAATAQTEEVSAAPEVPPTASTSGQSAEISFQTFIISLCTQALAHLGEIQDPVERSTNVDLDAARQIIDILAMLREKTKGNLDAAENSLLDNALYDLRMKYVERTHHR